MPTVPDIVAGRRDDEASQRIRKYYTLTTTAGRPAFSGAQFDDFEPEDNPRDRFTAADLLSTGLLGVHVSGDGIVRLLMDESRTSTMNKLLAVLPDDVDLSDLNDRAFAGLLDNPDSPGAMLWDMLRENDTRLRIRVGPTLASKLLARKRPRLIPIWDSKIEAQLGLKGSRDHWRVMRQILSEDDGKLVDRLETIRRKSGQQERISLLRTFDVAVWHAEKYKQWEPTDSAPEIPEDEDPAVGETPAEKSER